MKKKLLVIAFVCLFIVILAVTALAEEIISVSYNWYGGDIWEDAVPNGDGSFTLRSEKKSGDGTVTLTDGTVVEKQ